MISLKNFITILLSRIQFHLKSNKFPKEIIPKVGFLSKIPIDELIERQNLIVIRRVDKSSDETFNTIGTLREDALIPKEIPFLSLNILGGAFKIHHSKYKINKDGMERWDGNRKIKLFQFRDSFTEIDNYTIIFMDTSKINNQNFPYNQPKSTEINKEIANFFKHVGLPSLSGGEFNLEGKIKLLHDPLNLNYWHAELNIIDFKGDSMKFKRSKYIEKLCSEIIVNIICINSYKAEPCITSIPKQYYIKKKAPLYNI
jgi:hypothetical protein